MANKRRLTNALERLRRIHASTLKTLTLHMEARTPGWIGPIPYVAALQWIICIAIPLRFWAVADVHPLSRILIPSAAMVLIAAITTLFALGERNGRHFRRWHGILLGAAVVIISWLYLLTHNIRSDVYLLYFLPFIYAAEYFKTYGTLTVFGATCASFAYVLYRMTAGDPVSSLVVFVTREVFFFAVLGLGALLIAIG